MGRTKLVVGIALLVGWAGCDGCNQRTGAEVDATSTDSIDAKAECVGLECKQVKCTNGKTTSLSGTVFMPNGTLPLPNVDVYIPNAPVAPIASGASCAPCGELLSGNPLVQTKSDTEGKFVLNDVPVSENLPLVIQIGKWRREVKIPTVTSCDNTALTADATRLPRTQAEGNIPLTALSTGDVDSLECLLRKVGIADSEITTNAGTGRVHLFSGNGANKITGGATMAASRTALWDSTASLAKYDVTFLSCEGSQQPSNEPVASREAVKAYADMGGRVFASHWHNYWLRSAPAPWASLFTWNITLGDLGGIVGDVNVALMATSKLADWLVTVGASTIRGQIQLNDTKQTLIGVDETQVTKWITKDVTANNNKSVQYASFNTPVEAAPDSRCGRVVFADIHVSTGDESTPSKPFPTGCTTDVGTLTPQEKVLAFMMFDIGSCVVPVE